MPFATSFYRDRRLIITRAWGHITLADVRAHQQELRQRPEFDPTWAHVIDARDAVQFDVSNNEIRPLAETSVFAPSARRAMVASDLAVFDLFRMYGTLFELQVDGSAVGCSRRWREPTADPRQRVCPRPPDGPPRRQRSL
jgi:hypothetical protein